MKITEIKEKVPKPVKLPDGIYQGKWGGYKIELFYNKKHYVLTTEEGVRGVNINVVVTIKDGIGTFKELNN